MQVAVGMSLIVLSQAVQAAQVTFEDYFMSEMSIPAMKIVGYEGAIGTFLMLFVMAPIVRLLPGTPFLRVNKRSTHICKVKQAMPTTHDPLYQYRNHGKFPRLSPD